MTEPVEGNRITPWSESRSEAPVEVPADLADKNIRILNPLGAPDLYFELYDKAALTVNIQGPDDDEPATYELVRNINDAESGFHAKVIRNPETGHYVLLSKGMDMPGRDEGSGVMGFSDDIGDLKLQSLQTCISDQVLAAEQAYLELLQDPDVKSLEIIGYSIGSIPANYYAAVYDAKTTNIADLGVPGSVENSTQNFLAHTFNWCGNGFFPGVHGEFETNLNENVVGLELRADAMGGTLGSAGNRYGKQIVLDENDLNLLGAAHVPEVYAATVVEHFPDTPQTETVTAGPMENNWLPTGQ